MFSRLRTLRPTETIVGKWCTAYRTRPDQPLQYYPNNSRKAVYETRPTVAVLQLSNDKIFTPKGHTPIDHGHI